MVSFCFIVAVFVLLLIWLSVCILSNCGFQLFVPKFWFMLLHGFCLVRTLYYYYYYYYYIIIIISSSSSSSSGGGGGGGGGAVG